MRIVFMGSSDFSTEILRSLNEAQEVCGVFTQPDRKRGRGKKLSPTPVKEYAKKQGLRVFQPESLKQEEALESLEALEPELIVVAAYGLLLPPEILRLPKYGCLNVHASLLPKYRGAAPVQRALMDGEKYTGVTIMLMDEGLDTGAMLLKQKVEIGENENSEELTARLSKSGAKLILEAAELCGSEKLSGETQDDSLSSYAKPLFTSDSYIDFSRSAKELHDFIRALSPKPSARALLDGELFKIYASERTTRKAKAEERPGQLIVSEGSLFLCCGDGELLKLLSVQTAGSKRMPAEAFIRGHEVGGAVLSGPGCKKEEF